MVGTPSKIVTRSRSITLSAAAGSKREINVRHAPVVTAQLSPQVCPNAWNNGRHPISTSCGPTSNISALTCALRRRFACVSSAPFGVPVVPDV